jgi:hypothetical protein
MRHAAQAGLPESLLPIDKNNFSMLDRFEVPGIRANRFSLELNS